LSVTFVELCPRRSATTFGCSPATKLARGWPTCGASHGGATGGVVPTDVAGCRWLAFGRTPERTALGGNHGHRADRTRGCRSSSPRRPAVSLGPAGTAADARSPRSSRLAVGHFRAFIPTRLGSGSSSLWARSVRTSALISRRKRAVRRTFAADGL